MKHFFKIIFSSPRFVLLQQLHYTFAKKINQKTGETENNGANPELFFFIPFFMVICWACLNSKLNEALVRKLLVLLGLPG